VRDLFGVPCTVAVNQRVEDTPGEIQRLIDLVSPRGVKVILARHFAEGGKGAVDVAKEVVRLCDQPSNFKFVYDDNMTLWDKIKTVASKVYHASDIDADAHVRTQINRLQHSGYGHYPVCIAKTQYSFTTDPKLRGAPSHHIVNVREVRLAAGAEFIVVICGDIMTMPGLPEVPAANSIDVDENGKIVGLF
jgi:formate--tetrahydrofolate ligase